MWDVEVLQCVLEVVEVVDVDVFVVEVVCEEYVCVHVGCVVDVVVVVPERCCEVGCCVAVVGVDRVAYWFAVVALVCVGDCVGEV